MRLAYLLSAVGLVAALLLSSVASGREPTEFEQYMLERLNFARADPEMEVDRLSSRPWGDDGNATPDLNEGLAAGTITTAPKQPLAFNLMLIDAASDYSDTLLENDAFTHTYGGTNIKSRAETAGYSFVPSWSVGENLAVIVSSAPKTLTQEEVDDHHANLFIDDDVSGRGHRTNMMASAWREVGLGIRTSNSYGLFPCCSNAVLTTQDFAFTSTNDGGPYITGVAYRDLAIAGSIDGFYTPESGEALGGLDVDVLLGGTNTLVASTTTLLSGGYKIGGFGAGTYDVRFSGLGVDETYRGVFFDGTINLKLDAIDPGFHSLPADLPRNGSVDFADLTILLANWNQPVGAEFGNLVMPDGTKVDFADLTVLLAAWTGPAAAGAPQAASGAAAVPEPASWSLALIAMLAAIACPRRRNPLDARSRKH